MSVIKQEKNLRGRPNDETVVSHFVVPYLMNSNSRYKHIDELVLLDGRTMKATLGPIDLSIIPSSLQTIFKVTASEKNRLDIVAYKTYGQAQLWWVLAYANKLSDPLTLPAGTLLFVPSLSDLKQFPNPLS